jgi:HSP20 family protein
MKFKNLIPAQWESHSKPVRFNPEYSFFTLEGDMDRFFNHLNTDFFENSLLDFRPITEQNHFPKVDVTETKSEFFISAELPGIYDKDIDVTLEDGTLTFKGEKKVEKENNQGEFYCRERSYGAFQRNFKVPETIDQNKIDASFNKGILTVKLPKTPESKKEVKNIPINH